MILNKYTMNLASHIQNTSFLFLNVSMQQNHNLFFLAYITQNSPRPPTASVRDSGVVYPFMLQSSLEPLHSSRDEEQTWIRTQNLRFLSVLKVKSSTDADSNDITRGDLSDFQLPLEPQKTVGLSKMCKRTSMYKNCGVSLCEC